MITSQEIAEILKAHSKELGTSRTIVEADGTIRSCLKNRIHPTRPHTLRVCPPDEKDTLRIRVSIETERQGLDAREGAMLSISVPFKGGYLKLDSQDGITYEFSEPWKGEGNGPSAESVKESLYTVVQDLRQIEMLILHAEGLVHAASRVVPVDDGHEWPNP
jgi:hypothetical protein